eukprot:scaffold340978_cov42-Prasinocladus_malaysianus.AAC.1
MGNVFFISYIHVLSIVLNAPRPWVNGEYLEGCEAEGKCAKDVCCQAGEVGGPPDVGAADLFEVIPQAELEGHLRSSRPNRANSADITTTCDFHEILEHQYRGSLTRAYA